CLKSFSVKAIKIGAICSTDNILAIVHSLQKHPVKHIILDPVLASTGGKGFLDSSALNILTEELFPLIELITPNRPEFELLTGQNINDIDTAIDIARDKCRKWNTSILLKGGHYNCATIKEAIVTNTEVFRFERQRKKFQYQHGTGCTLSSALACYFCKGLSLTEAYIKASEYLVDFYDSVQDEI
nr:bifunctional hydroxymethylpyrimidine kinase/phosphomethylpyrimidine kinase [Tenuifilaceae bacterium]